MCSTAARHIAASQFREEQVRRRIEAGGDEQNSPHHCAPTFDVGRGPNTLVLRRTATAGLRWLPPASRTVVFRTIAATGGYFRQLHLIVLSIDRLPRSRIHHYLQCSTSAAHPVR